MAGTTQEEQVAKSDQVQLYFGPGPPSLREQLSNLSILPSIYRTFEDIGHANLRENHNTPYT